MTNGGAPTYGSFSPSRMRRAGAIGVGFAVIGGAVAWWAIERKDEPDPRVLTPWTAEFSLDVDPVDVRSSTMQIGFMSPYGGKEDPETLTFRSATAHFRQNSAEAVATISVCLPLGSRSGGLGGGGSVREPTLARACREARPVEDGTKMQWGTESDAGEFLVLTVRPTRSGVAEIDSLSFDYSRDEAHGGQSGVENIVGQAYIIRAK